MISNKICTDKILTHLRWEIQRIEAQLDHAPDTRATLLRAERRGLVLALTIVSQHARTRRRAPDCRGVTGGYMASSGAAGRVEGAV